MDSYRILYHSFDSNEVKEKDIILTKNQFEALRICINEYVDDFKVYLIDHDEDEFIELDLRESVVEQVDNYNYRAVIGRDPQFGTKVFFNELDFIQGCHFFCSLFNIEIDDLLHEIEE